MGIVYRAEDVLLNRPVALKFLPQDLTRDPEAKQRFIDEAKAASALDHTNICVIHDIGDTDEGQLFIVMACYDGETLKTKIERGPLVVSDALNVASQVAQGLSRAHEQGIIHRDIKPANIVITKEGVAKVIDFGLATLCASGRVTRAGTTLGTVAYMPPEVLQGERADARSDLFSLGVVLYEMLTGTFPFRGEHESAFVYSILNQDPEPLDSYVPDAPPALCRLCSKSAREESHPPLSISR